MEDVVAQINVRAAKANHPAAYMKLELTEI